MLGWEEGSEASASSHPNIFTTLNAYKVPVESERVVAVSSRPTTLSLSWYFIYNPDHSMQLPRIKVPEMGKRVDLSEGEPSTLSHF